MIEKNLVVGLPIWEDPSVILVCKDDGVPKTGSARISVTSPELLWQVLTAKRWELLKALCGAGPMSIREAARRVDRDVKAVHGDVTALLPAGLLDRAEGGGTLFPYKAIEVEFLLRAA